MKISDFIHYLQTIQAQEGDLELIETRYSDYGPMEMTSWGVVKAVPKRSYIMRAHPSLAEGGPYLHYEGN